MNRLDETFEVADTARKELRGTAFGLFNLVSGAALLLASVIAGALWTAWGAPATFLAGAVFAAFTACALLVYREKPSTPPCETGQ
ncbi:MAG: MFS transporter [Phycisphaerales bacterium]